MAKPKPRNPATGNLDLGETRLTSRIRLILAVATLVITMIDPSEPSRYVTMTYGVLGVYSLYGLVLFLLSAGATGQERAELPWLHWIDCGFYVVLIGLSGGTNSIYYSLFFFPIIVASFRLGFAAGLRVTFVSLLLFVFVGYWTRPPAPEFDLNRLLLRAMSLPLLGYMLAYWGGYELRLKKNLAFLREISVLSNPRFGVDRTFATNLEQIRAFFQADCCLAVSPDPSGDGYLVRRAVPSDHQAAMRPERIPSQVAARLLPVGEDEVLSYKSQPARWWQGASSSKMPSVSNAGDGSGDDPGDVCELLGSPSFLSAPLRSSSRELGRVYVARQEAFRHQDADFLMLVLDQMMPVLENVRLVDHMASRAADEERQRIARDIHDRIIQPYIGLQYGVTSMSQLFDSLPPERLVSVLKERASRILELTETGISELRQYVAQLKYGEGSGTGLVESLRRFTQRFYEVTGIRFDVRVEDGFTMNDRLAAEVLAMVTEGISNVRRHTHSERGSIEMWSERDRLIVAIRNERTPADPPDPFAPASIAGRAASLQGVVRVNFPGEMTEVVVEIPL